MEGRARRFVSALAVAATLVGCKAVESGSRAEHIAPQPVKVEKRDIVGYAAIPGRLDVPAGSVAVVHPPYNAPVDKVMSGVGHRVRRGEVLLTLQIPGTQENYQENGQALKQAETALANAKLQYGANVKAIDQQLAQARSRERTLRDYARTSGDASQLQAAEQDRMALEQQLAQARLEMSQQVQPFQDQLDQVRGTFREAKSGVRQSEVTAPISGTVISFNVKPGQVVGNDRTETLAEIVKLGAIRVRCEVSPEQAAPVRPHADVVVRFQETGDQAFDGSVTSVRKVPGDGPGNAVTEAIIDFKNDMGQIKPNMHVSFVGVATGKAVNVLAVPANAVAKDDSGKPFVHRLENGRWQNVVVDLGLSDGVYTQIKSGLQEGDTVQSPIQARSE